MSDENGDGLFNPQAAGDGAGTPASEPETPLQPAEGDGVEPQEPKYVTEDALQKHLSDFERRVQSSRDSALSSFDKRYKDKLAEVDRIIEANKAAQIEITPEQEQKLRQRAFDQASSELVSDEPGSPSPGGTRQSADMEAIIEKTNARASKIAEQFGIALEKSDPEYRLLEQGAGPDAFLVSLRNALYAKGQRVGQETPPPQARVPSMGRATPGNLNGKEQQFLKEYKAAMGVGSSEARKVRMKWRDQGLNVDTVISANIDKLG